MISLAFPVQIVHDIHGCQFLIPGHRMLLQKIFREGHVRLS